MQVTLMVRPQLTDAFFNDPDIQESREDQDTGSDVARLTEAAGRICYDSYGKGRSSADYSKHILELGHGSVLSHAVFVFKITGVSRSFLAEITRHHVGTGFSVESTRFVKKNLEDIRPHHPHFDDDDYVNLVMDDVLPHIHLAYSAIFEHVYNNLTQKGVSKDIALKQARGAARQILPAIDTAMYFSANLRALRNIIEQRASHWADAEIRVFANKLFEVCKAEVPEYFADYEVEDALDGVGFAVKTEHRKV